MSNTLSRLKLLFAELGIDTESGSYDKAEIVAYAAGIDLIKNTIDESRKRIFDLWSDSLMPKEKYTMDNFDKRAKSVCKSYTIGKKNVLITPLFLNFGTDGVIRLPQRFVPAQV